ncbi:two-component sensor histidine kinase [Mangrovactinospora gilvigrisea]|uniref:Signal transduction histidine-protein kinase/phosphatase MprB n=1 Tax=Mangrovactinospora gilvigrisea TaxID=1428644 RepID=A0A1J7BAQ1_9ACTN|nr:HAMP domain-containing sensor histidine kinase [Mangrovactinospora gilvigrisea]OIV35775.1 two-component sensor histidine kinase [Mangrovactinospora gilvigrisea]
MRWALFRVAAAVTTMVALAFLVPLGWMVWETARDRAFTAAERQAAAFGPALAITTDRVALERALASSEGGAEHRIAVHVPPIDGQGATTIGQARASRSDVAATTADGRASTVRVPSGYALLQPVAVANGRIAVVEVYVPSGQLSSGVLRAWLILTGVALGLVALSVAVADRLGTRLVAAAGRLASAARDLGDGRLGVRVPIEPDDATPRELRDAGAAFNSMADRVVQLLVNERELAADLSHRLRTPLTVLRLNAAGLGEGDAADHTREAVAHLEREVDQIIETARGRGQAVRAEGARVAAAGCDAAEVMRERVRFWSALAEDEGRPWRLSGDETPAPVPLSRAELGASVDALLGNVFRHTAEGTAFSVDLHAAHDAVIVLVSDAGPGIVDPEAALLRGQGDGRAGSTGLGLDIARRAAESTGGGLAIGRSVLGGTEIRIRLHTGPAAPVPRPRTRRRRPGGA